MNRPDLSYKKNDWVDEAIKDREGEVLEASEKFENTHWFKFQLVAKAQLAVAMDMLKSYRNWE